MKPVNTPLLTTLVLRTFLKEETREVILGDLEEEYRNHVLPHQGRVAANWWFRRHAFSSLAAIWTRSPTPRRGRKNKGDGMLKSIVTDLRHGSRFLAKTPAFTLPAILALALGIGANTAVFSVVDAVLLRPLPFDKPDRLVTILESNPEKGFPEFVVAPANFADWRAQSHTFEELSAMTSVSFNRTAEGEPERITGARVSANMFDLLGIKPALGRNFLADEDRAGAEPVAIVSDSFWRSRLASNPDVIGKTIILNGESAAIVGVMPHGFQYPARAEVWSPLALSARDAAARGAHFVFVLGRLKQGVTIDQARAALGAIASGLQEQYPDTNRGWTVKIDYLSDRSVKNVKPALLILLGAVGLVLLIACANVANLLLARSVTRRKEIAIRTALGASRGRLIRQMLTESMLIAVPGGVLGLALAHWGTRALVAVNSNGIPRSREIGTDLAVMAFTLVISVVTGLLFGLIPAIHASNSNLDEVIREGGGRASGGSAGKKAGGLLVVSEIAMSVILLLGAGLLGKSFLRVTADGVGYNPNNALTMEITLPQYRYQREFQRATFFEQLIERIKALPGVQSVGATTTLPSDRDYIWGFEIEGGLPPSRGDAPSAKYYVVNSDYFNSMGIPLLRGRVFNDQDREGQEGNHRVAIINQAMAEHYFPGENPVGRKINIDNGPRALREIVGVVADTRQIGSLAEAMSQVYEPYLQSPYSTMILIARAKTDPAGLIPALRGAVAAVDRDQPVSSIRTLDNVISDAVAERKFALLLFGVFSAIALTLAALGVYGVMAFSVSNRAFEIGVRGALGASRGEVLGLILRRGMTLTLAGLAFGLAASVFLGQAFSSFSSLLYKVQVTDLATFLLISAVLLMTALIACLIPAVRAARMDPMSALRDQ